MERLLSLIYSLSPIKFKYENDEQGGQIVHSNTQFNDGNDYFTLLPIELIDKILEYCDNLSLGNMGDVNKFYQKIIYDRHRYIGIDFTEVANFI